MVGEDQVLAAAVDIDGLAQVAVGHGGALDMPAGTAGAPGGIPGGLPGLRCLPQGKIHGVLLLLAHVDPGSGLEILQGLMAQLAVFPELRGAVVHVPVGGIGVALVDKGLDQSDDLGDVLRGLGMHRGFPHSQARRVLFVLGDILLRHLRGGDALFRRPADDLVVHVREVLHEGHVVAPVFQVAPEHVEEDDGPGVAHVDIVVHRGAAGVHAHLSRLQGLEIFILTAEGIVKLHGCAFLFV